MIRTRMLREKSTATGCSGSQSRKGAVSIPLVLLVGVTVTAGISLISIMHQWRGIVETQLRLDRCVAQAAYRLRDTQNTIENLNVQMTALRAGIAAATVARAPGAREALQTLLRLHYLRQEGELIRWKARAVHWLAQGGCGEKGDGAMPLPSHKWTRMPEDALGPVPLEWRLGEPKELYVQAHHFPRHAAARIKKESTGISRWSAQWAAPNPRFGRQIWTNLF